MVAAADSVDLAVTAAGSVVAAAAAAAAVAVVVAAAGVAAADTVVVMLDGECSFQSLDPKGISIWWGAYVGMKEQIILSGDLAETAPKIVKLRAEARAAHGWIMDIYLLRRVLA